MSIEQAFQISLVDFLARLGHRPTKTKGRNYWYLSPYRNESTASFKVNIEMNQWFDFGTGEGGTIIKLVRRIYSVDNISVVLRLIEQQVPAPTMSHNKPPCEKQSDGAVWVNVTVGPLLSYPLLYYIRKRGIPEDIARTFCSEVSYEHNGRRYYAIAFRNNSGGYELRNPYFKGCMGRKEITVLKETNNPDKDVLVCHVFEGFLDYLSYLVLVRMGIFHESKEEQIDYIILNSVSNVSKVRTLLEDYDRIHTYLDNDSAGKNATKVLAEMRKARVYDMSATYGLHNDVNDFLCSLTNGEGEKK